MSSQPPNWSRVGAASLPAVVQTYLERTVRDERRSHRTVRVTQTGEMMLKPGAKPRPFTATEDFAIDHVAFAWRARFPILGPVALHVTDSYDGRHGGLEVRLLGLPLQRSRGPQLSLGEAFRYLAEIAWVPQAIAANRDLEWRQLDEHSAEVSTWVAGERIAVRLRFDEAGEIAQTLAERPRMEAGGQMTRWIGEYSGYREVNGVRLPTRGEVRWELPTGPYVYWRGRITSLELRE